MDRTDNTIKLSELIAEDPKKATENPEDSSMLNNQFAAVLDDDSLSNVLLLNNEISWKKVASKKALPDDTMIRNLSSLQTLRVTAQNGTEKDSDKYQINKGKKKQKVYGSNILAGVAYRKIMNNARDNKGEGANTLKDYKTYVVTDEEGKMLVEFSERYAITQASSTDQQTACMRLLWVMLSEAMQVTKDSANWSRPEPSASQQDRITGNCSGLCQELARNRRWKELKNTRTVMQRIKGA